MRFNVSFEKKYRGSMDLVKIDLILPFSMLRYILLVVPFNERREIPPSSLLFKSRYTASAMNKGNQEFPGLRFLRILWRGGGGRGDIFLLLRKSNYPCFYLIHYLSRIFSFFFIP